MALAFQTERTLAVDSAYEDQLAQLRMVLTGDLITAGHDQYEDARRTKVIIMDRRPLAIVRAANEEDVARQSILPATMDFPSPCAVGATVSPGTA